MQGTNPSDPQKSCPFIMTYHCRSHHRHSQVHLIKVTRTQENNQKVFIIIKAILLID